MKALSQIKNTKRSTWGLIFTLAFYITGAFLMETNDVEKLKKMGVAKQHEYVHTDSYGDEHEGQSLIEIDGLGHILTYRDIYLASIPMLLIGAIIGYFIFKGDSSYELHSIIIANCVLGILLVRVTSSSNIPSTILFWLGIIAATFIISPHKTDNT